MNDFLRKYRLRKLAMGGFTMDRPELQSAKGEGIIGKSVLQGAMSGIGAGNSLFGAGSALSGAGGALAGAGGQAAGLLGKAGGPIGMAASVLAGAGIGLLTGSKQRKKQDEAYKEQYNNEMNEYNVAKSNYFTEKLNQDRQALIDRDQQLNSQMRYGGHIPQYQKGGAINENKKKPSNDEPEKDPDIKIKKSPSQQAVDIVVPLGALGGAAYGAKKLYDITPYAGKKRFNKFKLNLSDDGTETNKKIYKSLKKDKYIKRKVGDELANQFKTSYESGSIDAINDAKLKLKSDMFKIPMPDPPKQPSVNQNATNVSNNFNAVYQNLQQRTPEEEYNIQLNKHKETVNKGFKRNPSYDNLIRSEFDALTDNQKVAVNKYFERLEKFKEAEKFVKEDYFKGVEKRAQKISEDAKNRMLEDQKMLILQNIEKERLKKELEEKAEAQKLAKEARAKKRAAKIEAQKIEAQKIANKEASLKLIKQLDYEIKKINIKNNPNLLKPNAEKTSNSLFKIHVPGQRVFKTPTYNGPNLTPLLAGESSVLPSSGKIYPMPAEHHIPSKNPPVHPSYYNNEHIKSFENAASKSKTNNILNTDYSVIQSKSNAQVKTKLNSETISNIRHTLKNNKVPDYGIDGLFKKITNITENPNVNKEKEIILLLGKYNIKTGAIKDVLKHLGLGVSLGFPLLKYFEGQNTEQKEKKQLSEQNKQFR